MRMLFVRPFILLSSASLQLLALLSSIKWKIDTQNWDSPFTHTLPHTHTCISAYPHFTERALVFVFIFSTGGLVFSCSDTTVYSINLAERDTSVFLYVLCAAFTGSYCHM